MKHQHIKLIPGLIFTALLASPLAVSASTEASPSPFLNTITLQPYSVSGTRFLAADSTTLKSNTRIIETPRAVSLIDDSRLREQDFQSAADLLFWVPGINSNGDSYHFYARGFRMLPNDWKVDGFAGRVIGGSYAPNLFGLESVAFLKGPAGLLYGAAGSPGGQISLSTKRPKSTPSTTIELRVSTFAGGDVSKGGDWGSKLTLDSTGPLSKDKRLLYRFLSSNEAPSPTPSTKDSNAFYRLSLSYQLDTAGKYLLTPMVEWSRENRDARGPIISPSSSLSTSDNRSSYSLSDISPRGLNLAAGERTDDNLTLGTDFTANFSEQWNTQASIRYHERNYALNAWNVQTATLTQVDPADPLSWTVKRRHTRSKRETNTLSFDINSTFEKTLTAKLKNSTQVGLNASKVNAYSYTSKNGADQSAINLYTGETSEPLQADASPLLEASGVTGTFAWNTYLQNRTTVADSLLLTLAAGYSGDSQDSGSTQRRSNLMPNASVVYLLSPKASLYASYSTSFQLPNSTYENANGAVANFDPIKGENFEIGAKAELMKDLVAASLSVFDTSLNNTLVQSESNELNPNGNRYYRQTDSGRKSRGVECEFTVSPVKDWETTATYTYLDAHDRKEGIATYAAELTPRHAVSIHSRYVFLKKADRAWTIRGGFIWQSERNGASIADSTATSSGHTDPLRLRSFHRFDAGLSYRYQKWNFAVNIENLTDELYLVTGSTGLNLNPCNPRSVSVRIAHTW